MIIFVCKSNCLLSLCQAAVELTFARQVGAVAWASTCVITVQSLMPWLLWKQCAGHLAATARSFAQVFLAVLELALYHRSFTRSKPLTVVIFQVTSRKIWGSNYSTLLPHRLKRFLLSWAAKLYRENTCGGTRKRMHWESEKRTLLPGALA